MPDGAAVIVITGLMASGKSTVAEALAARLPFAAHVRGDGYRRMIVSGRVAMTNPLGDAAISQLRLRHRLAVNTAQGYAAAGISAVVQDLYLGADLPRVLSLVSHRPLFVVVLAPRAEVIERRERERQKVGYNGWNAAEFDKLLRERTPKLGLWIDNSDISVDQTVEAILADLALAEII